MDQTIEYTKKLNKAQKCAHCGAQMKAYVHVLSAGLVQSFIKLAIAARDKERNEIHLYDELRLDKVEYNNFNKLKYWSIVRMSGNASGKWSLTEKGLEFVNNKITLKNHVRTFRNKVVERFGDERCIAEIVTQYTKEYWQTEFTFKIIDSKIVPVRVEDRQTDLFIPYQSNI